MISYLEAGCDFSQLLGVGAGGDEQWEEKYIGTGESIQGGL